MHCCLMNVWRSVFLSPSSLWKLFAALLERHGRRGGLLGAQVYPRPRGPAACREARVAARSLRHPPTRRGERRGDKGRFRPRRPGPGRPGPGAPGAGWRCRARGRPSLSRAGRAEAAATTSGWIRKAGLLIVEMDEARPGQAPPLCTGPWGLYNALDKAEWRARAAGAAGAGHLSR